MYRLGTQWECTRSRVTALTGHQFETLNGYSSRSFLARIITRDITSDIAAPTMVTLARRLALVLHHSSHITRHTSLFPSNRIPFTTDVNRSSQTSHTSLILMFDNSTYINTILISFLSLLFINSSKLFRNVRQ